MIHVLLVDDHDLIRAGIKKILDDASGIKVIGEVASGEQALKFVRETRPHVILMDMKMPGLNGLETTKKLLRHDPDLKILVLTICDNDLYPARLLQAGASGYLTKSATPDEVIRAIRAVQVGQRYISPDIANRLAFRHVSDTDVSPFEQLSSRELQVMMKIVKGVAPQTIAKDLCLSAKTVNSYRYRIFKKLNVKNDVALTILAMRHGFVDSEALPVE